MKREWRRGGADRAAAPSFDRIVGAAKTGDHDAVTLLYIDHVAMVYGYFRACGAADPDDLTSEVFMGMLRGLAAFEGDQAAFRRWLMTIAHRRLVDSRRRAGADKVELSEPSSMELLGGDGGADLEAVAFDAELIDAFGRLTDPQREVLALRFIADVSLQGVAVITGRPTGAVKSLQNRGLASLRRQLPATKARLGA